MKNIILFDPDSRDHLLPLTYTRPVCELRIGILTIREKWEKWLDGTVSYITQDYLSEKYPINISSDNLVINGAVLPDADICRLIQSLGSNKALLKNGELIAARLDEKQFHNLMLDNDIEELEGSEMNPSDANPIIINHLCDIFEKNDAALRSDFQLLTADRTSAPLSITNQVIGNSEQIFIEEGAIVEASILNTKTGPIYIGKNAEIMEGCVVRGGLALCEGAILKIGAKIYGATTIGPYSRVGGEVKNSVILANSNKGHDGYLGNSVLGEWCNLGADTNNSNLKNNYAEVKLWNYVKETYTKTGLQFVGLIMGDHSKTGINTMFNTGTVVGVSSNIFGAGYPPNFIPSFSWGGSDGFETYNFKKACETAERVVARRDLAFTALDINILRYIFEFSTRYRVWEKQKEEQLV